MTAAKCLLVRLPVVRPTGRSGGWFVGSSTYREGRCQSGRVPRGAFVKA